MREYSASDRHGSYKLNYRDKILRSVVKGAIGGSLARKFNQDIAIIFTLITDSRWGYFGDLSQCEAYTDEALALLPVSHLGAITSGCCVDAYLMGTALTHEQLRRVRKIAGIESELEQQVFDSSKECEAFIYAALSDIDSRVV